MRSFWQLIILDFCAIWAVSSIVMLLFHHYPYDPDEQKRIWGHVKSPREFYKIRRIAQIMKLTPLSIYMLFEFLCTQHMKNKVRRDTDEL